VREVPTLQGASGHATRGRKGDVPNLIDWGSATYGPVPMTDLFVYRDSRNTGGTATSSFARS